MYAKKETKNKYFKMVDADKVCTMTKKKYGSYAALCREIGVNNHQLSDLIRRGGYIRIVTMNSICHALDVPNDYFDKVEEPEPVSEPIEDPKEEPEECLINLADIQLSLNKIEALLLEQNRILRGKLIKGESNEIKGNTNHGFGHSYTVVPTNL